MKIPTSKPLHLIRKIISYKVPGSFTIEASVILPIVFVITVALITTSLTIHNKVSSFTNALGSMIECAPCTSSENTGSEYSELIALMNKDNLDGRRVLLKYKMLKDGIETLTGGLR